MSEQIYRQIEMALQNGKVIQAIKLLRQVENLDLRSAKEKIDAMVDDIRDGKSVNTYTQAKTNSYADDARTRPRAHSHTPARSETYNIESDLPTEAFLYLQKGEVARAIKIIQETKGISRSNASRMAKMFYQQHPEYTSKEISRLMSSTSSSTSSNSSLASTSKVKEKKKSKTGFFEMIVFIIIFVNVIRACAS